MDRKYIIVAGINGAGKSTLYELQPRLFLNTKRLNADEILRQQGGDWRNPTDNFKAMREEVKQLHEALKKGDSIHVETTLSGSGKSQLNLIDEAHKNGYEVTLLYVTLDSAERAIERVNNRVAKGGHGIPPEVIRKRYDQSHNNLKEVSFKSDNVYIYDNSQKFVKIYGRNKDHEFKNILDQYSWVKASTNSSVLVQKDLKKFSEKNNELSRPKTKHTKKDSPDI